MTQVTGWVAGSAIAAMLGAAPADRSAEIARCKSDCAAIESETDRATCRLACEQTGASAVEVTTFKQTRELGGAADGGTTTTVTTRTASGTNTTTAHEHTHGDVRAPTTGDATSAAARGTPVRSNTATTPTGPTPSTTTAAKPAKTAVAAKYAAWASCQAQCNPTTDPTARAQCKLKCLRAPTPATTSKSGRPIGASFGPPP